MRILKVGGKGLITVWAKEQKLNEKESYYIKKKGNRKEQSEAFRVENQEFVPASVDTPTETATDKPMIHDYGKEFEKQDLFVTWHHQTSKEKNKALKKVNEVESAKEKDSEVFLRFYHVFKAGELELLFEKIGNARIVNSFYEQGNWCVVFVKTK